MKPKEFVSKTLPREVIVKIENVDRTFFLSVWRHSTSTYFYSVSIGGMANIDIAYLTWDCVRDDGGWSMSVSSSLRKLE